MPGPFSRKASVLRKESERGAALIMFMLMFCLVVLPMVGLSIDGGVAYFAYERLTAAADAAALAGARSLNIGLTIDSQVGAASDVAQRYFNANFPTGLLNSSNATSKVTITPPANTSDHKIVVQVDSSADVGLYFLGLLGHTTAHLTASATTTRRDANVVLALDRSGSMAGVCDMMKNDAENFVTQFVNGRDTVGLVTFMGNAKTDYDSTKNFKSQTPSLNDTLATLKCGGNTGSAAALALARQQIEAVNEPGALNVIVFFTDGVPNGFLAGSATPGAAPGFPLKSGKSCNGSSSPVVPAYIADGGGLYDPTPQAITSTASPVLSTCPWGTFGQLAQSYLYIPDVDFYGASASASGYASVARDSDNHITFTQANSDAISKNAADDAARIIRNEGIIIYAIGLDGDGGVDGTLLKRIANDPSSTNYSSSQPAGKYYYAPNAGQLGAVFNAIASEILRISR